MEKRCIYNKLSTMAPLCRCAATKSAPGSMAELRRGHAHRSHRRSGRVAAHRLLFLLAPALIITSWTNSSKAAIYHVSQDGDDGADGLDWHSAWRTLAKAAAHARAGDTVIIRRGGRPYAGFEVLNSGAPGRPIVFRGENKAHPPVISGAHIERNWRRMHDTDLWTLRTGAKPALLVEDGRSLAAASYPPPSPGSWTWKDGILYYRPSNGTPDRHTLWRPSRGGGILIRGKRWIIIEDITCRVGNGACITIDNGSHNRISRVTAEWYWRGINILNRSHHNIIEDCLVRHNREGIYLLGASSYNTIRRCRALHNGNLPAWHRSDRAGIAIGESGPNRGNTVSRCEIAYNGGPNSDPGLIAYDAPNTVLDRNHVHHNYGSGVYVTIRSHDSVVTNNYIHDNGAPAVAHGSKGIAGLSIRRSRNVRVANNTVRNNHVSRDSPWVGKDKGPRGGLDIRGLPSDDMRNILLEDNTVSGTIGGPDVFISPHLRRPGMTRTR